MEDWQQRVVDEKADLDGKLERLRAFLNSKAFEPLPVKVKHAMHMQEHYMVGYQLSLKERIENF